MQKISQKMKKTILTALALTAILTLSTAQTSKTVRLKVIETSDVHGHFFPYDFMERKPLKGTLSRANTYINKEIFNISYMSIRRSARNGVTITCCLSTTATSYKVSPASTGRTM